ncbi:tail fiber domain-containing protein [uncultured Roseibium sp.]|uniref:tail fiber domain-containing protein n=1 Tax=uncultured Roseibium sp. TaxID=1936171 RepID=UPI0026388CD4|nr:tail fiber domain-containing protein [uncultured Roseibium sp.]
MSVLDYSETRSSNTAIDGIGISGSNAVQNFDDALRQIMADTASSITRYVTKAAAYTAVKADYRQLIEFTATATLSLTTASTLTSGWMCIVKANGGDVTIDPASSEQIDDADTKVLPDGSYAFVYCNGSAFISISLPPILDDILALTPTNGSAIVGNGATWGTLALGTAATKDTGTSGTKIPLLDGDNTHSGTNSFSNNVFIQKDSIAAEQEVFRVRDDHTTSGSTGNVVSSITRQNSPTNCLIFGNDGNNAALIGANNNALRVGKWVSGVFTEYLNISTSGVVDLDGSTSFRAPPVYDKTTSQSANVYVASGSGNELQRSTSSKRYKREIEDIEFGYSKRVVEEARPVYYRSKCQADKPDWSFWGLIAEELAELDPRLVQWREEGEKHFAEGVMYDRLVVHLIKYAQHLKDRIEVLERQA